MRPASSRAPYLPPSQRITYSLVRPQNEAGAGTYWRKATCEEVGCGHYARGWVTTLPVDDGRADYIRRESGRSFTEERAAGQAVFRFGPGQRCFAADSHQLPVEREPLYLVRGGDSRAWTGERRIHSSAEDWRDDFGEHQQKLHDAAQEG